MIELTDVQLHYTKHSTPLFNGLTLRLTPGHIYGLLGKNGAGKTSLLNVCAGLIFPNQGNVRIQNLNPAQRQTECLQSFYMVTEEFYLPMMTTNTFVKRYAPFYPQFDRTLLQQGLREFDLPDNKLLTELSHGQKKKFKIAFALATRCPLLILDEPTNGLDIPSKEQFRKLVAGAFQEDQTIIISTHQVHDVKNLIDGLVVLDQGKVILNSTLADLMSRVQLSIQTTEPTPGSYLYVAKQLGGYAVLTVAAPPNHQDDIDLEFLFNAILANPTTFQILMTGAAQ